MISYFHACSVGVWVVSMVEVVNNVELKDAHFFHAKQGNPLFCSALEMEHSVYQQMLCSTKMCSHFDQFTILMIFW